MSFTNIMIEQEMAKNKKHKQENPELYQKGMIWKQITSKEMQQAYEVIPEEIRTPEIKALYDVKIGTWEPAIVPEQGHLCSVKDIEKVINEVKKYLGNGNYKWSPL